MRGISAEQAISLSDFKSFFESTVLSTLKITVITGKVSVENITDDGSRRHLLSGGNIEMIYSILNQNKSASSVLALLSASATDGSFATSLNNKLNSQGNAFSITVLAPTMYNKFSTNIPSGIPTFTPSGFLGGVRTDSTKIYVALVAGSVIGGTVLVLFIAYLIYFYTTRKSNRYK